MLQLPIFTLASTDQDTMKSFLVLYSFLLAAVLSADIWVYEIDSDVYMRKGPDNKAKILGTLTGGEQIEVLEKTNEFWWKVEHEGTEGFVASSFIVVAVPETSVNMTMAAWDFILEYPAIIGVVLFVVVFGMIRKVQRIRNRKKK